MHFEQTLTSAYTHMLTNLQISSEAASGSEEPEVAVAECLRDMSVNTIQSGFVKGPARRRALYIHPFGQGIRGSQDSIDLYSPSNTSGDTTMQSTRDSLLSYTDTTVTQSTRHSVLSHTTEVESPLGLYKYNGNQKNFGGDSEHTRHPWKEENTKTFLSELDHMMQALEREVECDIQRGPRLELSRCVLFGNVFSVDTCLEEARRGLMSREMFMLLPLLTTCAMVHTSPHT